MNRLRLTCDMESCGRNDGRCALCLSLALPAAAQTVTTADIQRLQDQVYQASSDVSRMSGSQDDFFAAAGRSG